jgi:exodeoxyribonuclease V gamma subunit
MSAKEFYLHTSNRIELLAKQLAIIAQERPLPGPLDQETVMTLNTGMAKWLRFEIARSTGIAFGWEFPFPNQLFKRIATGFDSRFAKCVDYDEAQAQWELYDLFTQIGGSPEFSLVNAYSRRSSSHRLRLSTKLASLYGKYLLYRPDRIIAWERGEDRGDWQGELWRRLCRRIYGNRTPYLHTASLWELLRKSPDARPNGDVAAWPHRISVFGVSSLPPVYLDLLEAVSYERPVHIFLLQPTDLYWADLKSRKSIAKASRKPLAGDKLVSPELSDDFFDIGNPLLPSLGKQGQAFLDLILDKDPIHDDSLFEQPDPSSQLGCLHLDLLTLENRALGEKPTYPFPEHDGSIQIHSSSSVRREVEALWDYIVDSFGKNPNLKASDVLIMAPDIQMYASHLQSVFEQGKDSGTEIPLSVADRHGPRESNFLAGILSLLKLVSARASVGEILDILRSPIIHQAFDFDESEIDKIESWIRVSGTVWGWDAEHRDSFNAFATDRNTWKEFRLRLAAGIAFNDTSILVEAKFSPLPNVEGGSTQTAGRLIEFLEFLEGIYHLGGTAETVSNWSQRLSSLFERFSPTDRIESLRYFDALSILQSTLPDNSSIMVDGRDAVLSVAEALERSSPSSGYLTGRITCCSLKPMRSIPAKLICLLGMGNEQFPRRPDQLPFDLLVSQPRRGDRNPKEEDKQYFLETLLSARERLFISFQGISSVNDNLKEPSNVVSLLIDYMDDAAGRPKNSPLIVRHKRQSYDPDYFSNSELYTYSDSRARKSRSFLLGNKRKTANPEKTQPLLEEMDPKTVSIDSIIRFFKDPSKYFIQYVAGARFVERDELWPESDKIGHDPLDRYEIRKRFAETIQSGLPIDSVRSDLVAAIKLLPPGHLGKVAFDSIRERTSIIDSLWSSADVPRPGRIVNLDLAIGVHRIRGQMRLNANQDTNYIVASGKLNGKARIETWVRHLLANSINRLETRVYSLNEDQASIAYSPLEDPKPILHDLLKIFQASQSQPLPFQTELSWDAFQKTSKTQSLFDEKTFIDTFCVLSQSLFEQAEDSELPYSGRKWSQYDHACFGPSPLFNSDYGRLAIQIWQPYVESLRDL